MKRILYNRNITNGISRSSSTKCIGFQSSSSRPFSSSTSTSSSSSSSKRNTLSSVILGTTCVLAYTITTADKAEAETHVPSSNYVPTYSSTRNRKKGKKKEKMPKLPNPGPMQNIGREAKDLVNLQTFGGARFNVGKVLPFVETPGGNPHEAEKFLQTMCGFHLGNPQFEGGSLFEWQAMSRLGQMSIQGSTDSSNRTMGHLTYPFKNNTTFKSLFQINHEDQFMFNLEYDIPWNHAFINLSAQQNLAVFGINYHQSLTPNISAAVELLHALQFKTFFNAAMRFKIPHDSSSHDASSPPPPPMAGPGAPPSPIKYDVLTLQYSEANNSMSAAYHNPLTDSTSIAAELQVMPKQKKGAGGGGMMAMMGMGQPEPAGWVDGSRLVVGIQQRSFLYSFNACVDADGVVQSMLDYTLSSPMDPFQLQVNLSAEINYANGEGNFGVGMSFFQ